MRFFKYLVLIFASITSVDVLSATTKTVYYAADFPKEVFDSPEQACDNLVNKYGISYPSTKYVPSNTECMVYSNTTVSRYVKIFSKEIVPKCPPTDYPFYYYFDAGDAIPKQRCTSNSDGTFCRYIDKGNRIILNHEGNRQSVVLYSASEKETSSCTSLDEGQCDKTDPYGDCYQPPNDGCTRQKDGSIVCPDNTPPPKPDDTCKGATYCKRPPEGCGKGYVSGSFNGQQLCVKSGPSDPQPPTDPDDPIKPNDPNDPNDPNKCSTEYCPKPDPNKDCPVGYYKTNHNGSNICVRDNPKPNQPNPNDPNNNQPPTSEPQPGDGDADLSGVIDAIRALRDSLLGAIDGVSKKLTDLINGQKTTNEHLKNIKDESVKTNEKLDKSNESLKKISDSMAAASEAMGIANDHLDKIEDATQAASEGIGETNKKLDGVNDSIQGMYKCKNESYNPNDKTSQKYRECTDQDLKTGPDEDGKISVLEKEVDTNFDANIINASAQCPPPMVIRFNLLQAHEITFSYENFCYGASLARPWVIFVGMLIAFMIVTGQYKGGSDA